MRVNVKAAALLLGLVALLVLAAIPWPVDREHVQAELTRDSVIPGYSWSVATRASLALLPRPTLRLTLPEMLDPEGHVALHARKAVISLAPGPLLLGRFVAASTRLIDADLSLDRDRVVARLTNADALRALARGRVEFVRGRIAWHGGGAQDGLLRDVEGWIDWPGAEQAASYRLSALWQDQVVRSEGEIDAPGKLLAGSPSKAQVSVNSPPLDFTFSGLLRPGGAANLSGDIQVALRDPAALAALAGASHAPAIPKPLELQGQIEATANELSLSQARLQLGGQLVEGSLQLRNQQARWKASGTLAMDRLDLAALFGPPPALVDAQGLWRSDLPLPRPYEPVDLDLRLSAGTVTWGAAEASDIAATLSQEHGALQVNIVEGKAYEGVATGALTISDCATTCRERAVLSLTGARLDPLLAALGLKSGLSGHGSLGFDLEASGGELAEAIGTIGGTAEFMVQDGTIAGLNLEEALRRSQHRVIDPARDMAAGDSHFTEARLDLVFNDGLGEIARGRVDSPAAVAEAEGVIDLLHREIRARVSARQVGPEGAPSPDAARLGISIRGPWALPSLTTIPDMN